MSETFVIPAMGWLPDYPDIRDVTFQSERVPSKLQALGQPSVKQMLAKVGATTSAPAALPASVDLRAWCSLMEERIKKLSVLVRPTPGSDWWSILSGELLANTSMLPDSSSTK